MSSSWEREDEEKCILGRVVGGKRVKKLRILKIGLCLRRFFLSRGFRKWGSILFSAREGVLGKGSYECWGFDVNVCLVYFRNSKKGSVFVVEEVSKRFRRRDGGVGAFYGGFVGYEIVFYVERDGEL